MASVASDTIRMGPSPSSFAGGMPSTLGTRQTSHLKRKMREFEYTVPVWRSRQAWNWCPESNGRIDQTQRWPARARAAQNAAANRHLSKKMPLLTISWRFYRGWMPSICRARATNRKLFKPGLKHIFLSGRLTAPAQYAQNHATVHGNDRCKIGVRGDRR
ncbi:hypothetical protein [Blastomonas sp. SL216]|uniref:hypothetical protein n=1 Tax=Blastomonas sp. SL216 TaxID=2995169 RepID=UPI00237747F1|nr:hypothetical protein OU999_12365 [Blastomonas sp. SL216]